MTAPNKRTVQRRDDGGGELAVRGNNGRIRAQDTISPGNDPRSSRG